MILTDKAKKDFESWIYDQGVTGQIDISNFEFDKFEFLSKTSQYAIITDWLDSVGIYVSIHYVDIFDELESKKGFESYVTKEGLTTKFRPIHHRQAATESAIKSANEIYNNEKRN